LVAGNIKNFGIFPPKIFSSIPGAPKSAMKYLWEIFLRFSLLKSRIVGLIEKVMGSRRSGPFKEAFLAGKIDTV
jgi:hypothetical protein